MDKQSIEVFIDKALEGNTKALEEILLEVKDLIYNLSLRMLGTSNDADDATQDILVRVMTNLASFRKESSFSTWVYRIAVNYLIDYKKSMFAQRPLDFEFYANDIKAGYVENTDELMLGVSKEELAQELKMSCTNVMLQCLDPQTRSIFILGTMFKVDSKMAGDILGISADNYRQKLSRARKKMASFLKEYCGLNGGLCNCQNRIGYAILTHRLNPNHLEYKELKKFDDEVLLNVKTSMEQIDEYSTIFDELPKYQSKVEAKVFIEKLLQSEHIKTVQSY